MNHDATKLAWLKGAVILAKYPFKKPKKTYYSDAREVVNPRFKPNVIYEVAPYKYSKVYKHKDSGILTVIYKNQEVDLTFWNPITDWIKTEI